MPAPGSTPPAHCPTAPVRLPVQTMSDDRAADYMRGKRIMEVNPGHPLIRALRAAVDLDSREARQQVELLYEAASLVGETGAGGWGGRESGMPQWPAR